MCIEYLFILFMIKFRRVAFTSRVFRRSIRNYIGYIQICDAYYTLCIVHGSEIFIV